MIITKEFTVKETDAFRLRVKMWKCLRPADLNNVDFIQETLDKDGKVLYSSTYNFFLTDEDINGLCKGLTA